MDPTCRQFPFFYNPVTDKTREVVLRGSCPFAILVLLASPLSGLARGSRDSQAMSLPYLFRAFWPARCSEGLAIELDDLRSVYQSVQHRHHDLRVSQVESYWGHHIFGGGWLRVEFGIFMLMWLSSFLYRSLKGVSRGKISTC